MPGTPNHELLEGILAACILELLADLKLRGRRITGDRAPRFWQESLAAHIGFDGTDLRGSITMLGPLSMFAQLCPLPASSHPPDLQDFACELLNQTAGRFRNRLLAHQVSVTPRAPESTMAETVRLVISPWHGRNPIRVAVEGAVLDAWLDLAIRPGYRLPAQLADERAAVLREGAMLFF